MVGLVSLIADSVGPSRHPEVEAHSVPHLPYGTLDPSVEDVLNTQALSSPRRGGLNLRGSGGAELLDSSVSIRELVICRNRRAQYVVGRDHLRVPVTGHEGLPGMLQLIRISIIEETVLESSPEFPRSRMKRGVVLAAIEEGGSPPLLFPVFESLLFCGFDLLRSCPVSVSLRKHWRGECPHHGNNGGQEGRNISAQLVSVRFRAFDDPSTGARAALIIS